jgi:hypothetical protein
VTNSEAGDRDVDSRDAAVAGEAGYWQDAPEEAETAIERQLAEEKDVRDIDRELLRRQQNTNPDRQVVGRAGIA